MSGLMNKKIFTYEEWTQAALEHKEAEIARLREALELIASCTCTCLTGDCVVCIAKKALRTENEVSG